jgi:NADH:ubiquinone oxidoreductase subunit F (NADH-binding)
VIEGMALAAFATGSSQGFIYIRGEYHRSIKIIRDAIEQATEAGLLGEQIFGTDFSFQLSLVTGSGAYICGEETALLESMEGKRGEPRQKPPYPGERGLWGRSTIVNNVETLANLPPLVRNGAAWFRQLGTESCPGTKVFTLTGDVIREGLVEVPMGTTLRDLIYKIGGGIRGGSFKLAQTGGNSGGCLPEAFLDLPLDYDTLAKAGTTLGSGALLIVNDTHCTVDLVKNILEFFAHESCGHCTPCREGTWQLTRVLENLVEGKATKKELTLAQELAGVMQSSCLCGLGQSAPASFLTTLEYFQEEYLAHLAENCPVGSCRREQG